MSRETIKEFCLVLIDFRDQYLLCVLIEVVHRVPIDLSEKAIETRQGDLIALFIQSTKNKYIVSCLTINII